MNYPSPHRPIPEEPGYFRRGRGARRRRWLSIKATPIPTLVSHPPTPAGTVVGQRGNTGVGGSCSSERCHSEGRGKAVWLVEATPSALLQLGGGGMEENQPPSPPAPGFSFEFSSCHPSQTKPSWLAGVVQGCYGGSWIGSECPVCLTPPQPRDYIHCSLWVAPLLKPV